LTQENEDLRDRLSILEEHVGKDSNLADITTMAKEKRQLENRVKHLEKTTQNWNNVRQTRENFFKRNN